MTIRAENISKRFGEFHALRNVTLDFDEGEFVALLGPSGCGKTTLLRIIAGLESADEGKILLDGEDASSRHVRERQVGFVFQHYALFRHMSVFENIAFGLRVKPRDKRPSDKEIRRKVTELLDLVQLGWLADRSPAQLSGGQRQRIALARALAVEPRVLLLDEPFGALDAKVRVELRRWLRLLHNELGLTSVFVTHDQEEALELADRVVVMNKGQAEQVGTPKDVYDNPTSAFVYSFLGTSNRFTGRVESGKLAVDGWQHSLDTGDFDGKDVLAFARPHELRLLPPDQGTTGIPARIGRIIELGAIARIELQRDGNSNRLDMLEAEYSRRDLEGLKLTTGDRVQVVPERLQIFTKSEELPTP